MLRENRQDTTQFVPVRLAPISHGWQAFRQILNDHSCLTPPCPDGVPIAHMVEICEDGRVSMSSLPAMAELLIVEPASKFQRFDSDTMARFQTFARHEVSKSIWNVAGPAVGERMKTILAFLACLLFAAPTFAQDMIDPSTIRIVDAPDFRGWKVAGRFSSIVVQPDGNTFHVDGQSCDHFNPCWPIVTSQVGQLQFTIWLFLQINGQWVGSAFFEGINDYHITAGTTGTLPGLLGLDVNWYYSTRWAPMTGHIIREGETIGFMFGGGDNRDSHGPNSGIRSNIVTAQATAGPRTYN